MTHPETVDLKSRGCVATGALGELVGVGQGGLTPTFITEQLRIAPFAHVLQGYYWTPAHVRQIRRALIKRLVDLEFASDPTPPTGEPE